MAMRTTVLCFLGLTLGWSVLTSTPAHGEVPEFNTCKGALQPTVGGDCGDVSPVGCCDGFGRNLWCQGGSLFCLDCPDGFAACGWNSLGYYDCGQVDGTADPSGTNAATCGGCPGACAGSAPCSAQCSGTCGSCADGAVCLPEGSCYEPQCDGKECGKDPEGFSCGTCAGGEICVDGLAVCQALPVGCAAAEGPGCESCACEACVCAAYPSCCSDNWDTFCATACELECGMDCSPCPAEPTCDGLGCGSFCGLDCGSCGAGQVCQDNSCCTTACDGKACGPDGCGGICGTCDPFDECDDGICVECAPKCQGLECGADGCGGSCGECGLAETCEGGLCVDCQPSCQGKECGDDGCGGECGPCVEGQSCANGLCLGCGTLDWVGCCDEEVSKWCQGSTPKNQTCADGCGWDPDGGFYDCGFEGVDPTGQHHLDCHACRPSCEGRACGSDGCDGLCGTCATGERCSDGLCLPESACGEVSETGCCDGDSVQYCASGYLSGYTCGGAGCGWNPSPGTGTGWYDCGSDGYADPSGQHLLPCPGCVVDCGDRTCGHDGCGGSCGGCRPDEICEGGGCVDLLGAENPVNSGDGDGPGGDAKEDTDGGGCNARGDRLGGGQWFALCLLALLLPYSLRRKHLVEVGETTA